MPRPKPTPVNLHPSWSFPDRKPAIERLLNNIDHVLRHDDQEIGVVTSALLFALIAAIREIRPDNALAMEAKIVEMSGLHLLKELDKMYCAFSEKDKREMSRVH